MQILMMLFTALLFIALSPGVLLSLPPGGSKMTVVVVHALVFAVVYCLSRGAVSRYLDPQGFMDKDMY